MTLGAWVFFDWIDFWIIRKKKEEERAQKTHEQTCNDGNILRTIFRAKAKISIKVSVSSCIVFVFFFIGICAVQLVFCFQCKNFFYSSVVMLIHAWMRMKMFAKLEAQKNFFFLSLWFDLQFWIQKHQTNEEKYGRQRDREIGESIASKMPKTKSLT